MLKANNQEVTLMLSLEVPDEELVKRLLQRGQVSGRADDADPAVIQNRINVYKAQTAIVADYYAAQNKLHKINGVGSIEEIFNRLCTEIDKY
jgi:adenylate kinase